MRSQPELTKTTENISEGERQEVASLKCCLLQHVPCRMQDLRTFSRQDCFIILLKQTDLSNRYKLKKKHLNPIN